MYNSLIFYIFSIPKYEFLSDFQTGPGEILTNRSGWTKLLPWNTDITGPLNLTQSNFGNWTTT